MKYVLVGALATGCAGSPEPMAADFSPPCKDEAPRGNPDDYKRAERSGFEISKPMPCAAGEAYIRIEHTIGRRTIGMARGKRDGCLKLPRDPADATECPVIHPQAILVEASAQLARLRIETKGVGLGPCGDIDGDYAALNLSAGVASWKDAATLEQIITDLLARYDIDGYVGASVRGHACVR